jgi:hypothetical protein
MRYVALVSPNSSFRILELVPGDGRVQYKTVLKSRLLGNKSTLERIQLSPDNGGHLLIQFADHYRIIDFKKNLKDVSFFSGSEYSVHLAFSPTGQYLISVFQKHIALQMPVYHLKGWLARTPAQELDISQRISFGIADLREQFTHRATRNIIVAQLLSFVCLLLLLVRYLPVGFNKIKQGQYYKPVLYGMAGLLTMIAVIFKEFFFEPDEGLIELIAGFFMFISFYVLLLIIYEHKEDFSELYKAKAWLRLSLLIVPECIALAFCIVVLLDEAFASEEDIWDGVLVLLLFCIFNTLNLWLVHRSERLYKSASYLRMAAMLYLPVNYLLFLLVLYLDADFGETLFIFSLLYLTALPSVWLLRRIWRMGHRIWNKAGSMLSTS